MGNPESGSGLPAEMHGVFTSGDGVQKNGRKEYKRDTKKTCIEDVKVKNKLENNGMKQQK